MPPTETMLNNCPVCRSGNIDITNNYQAYSVTRSGISIRCKLCGAHSVNDHLHSAEYTEDDWNSCRPLRTDTISACDGINNLTGLGTDTIKIINEFEDSIGKKIYSDGEIESILSKSDYYAPVNEMLITIGIAIFLSIIGVHYIAVVIYVLASLTWFGDKKRENKAGLIMKRIIEHNRRKRY